MRKDYAKQNRHKLVAADSSKSARWNIILIGLIILCVLGTVLFTLGKKSYYTLSQTHQPHVSSPQAAQAASDVHFDFYAELPNRQAMPPPVTKKTSITQPVTKYMVQVGQFAHATTATQTRISLLLAGFDVELVKVNKGSKSVYQLQQGPYANKATALGIQQALRRKGIESVVVTLANDSKRPHIN